MKNKKIINNPKEKEQKQDDLVADIGDVFPETGDDTFKDFRAPPNIGAVPYPEKDENGKEYKGVKLTVNIRKRRMLATMEQSLMNIGVSCHSAGVTYSTYYRWRDEDPEFRKAVDQVEVRMLSKVEDKLKELIASGKESSVHFLLKSKHPSYRPRLETNNNPDAFTGTLDDLLRQADEDADILDAQQEEKNAQENKSHATPNEQGHNPETVQNQKQKGLDSIVQAQRDPEPLLGKTESPQSNS